MQKALVLGIVLAGMSTLGCKKQVPNDIVEKSLRGVLNSHAPQTTSAMCGVRVKGLSNSTITVKSKNVDNTGIAHVKGTPWLAAGTPPFCEGDVQFKFSSTSKTSGYKRKTTTTTWWPEQVSLVAVQTPGVTSKTVNENPDGDEE